MLRLLIQTPGATVLDVEVYSVRVPTLTGWVGMRPHGEPTLLAIEPGLIIAHRGRDQQQSEDPLLSGTAGGLVTVKRDQVTVATPMAVIGNDEEEIARELDRLAQQSHAEVEARVVFGKLEKKILHELRQDGAAESLPSVEHWL